MNKDLKYLAIIFFVFFVVLCLFSFCFLILYDSIEKGSFFLNLYLVPFYYLIKFYLYLLLMAGTICFIFLKDRTRMFKYFLLISTLLLILCFFKESYRKHEILRFFGGS